MRFFYLLVVFQLIAFHAVWCDVFDPSDNSANGAVLLPSPSGTEQTHGPHDLSSSDVEDWFQVLLTANETYTIFTTSDSVTVGRVYDQSENVLVGDNPFNQSPKPFRVNFTPEESGIYFIQITSLDPNEMIRFTLHTINRTTTNAPTDRFDPGDDGAFAPPALNPPTLQLQSTELHNLSTIDTQDWYLIMLQAGTTYEFFTTGNYELTGDLFINTGNTRVAAGLPNEDGLNFSLLFNAQQTGTFFLRIQSIPAAWNASYNLHYKISAQSIEPGDEWDPKDDIIEGATIIRPANAVREHGSHSLTPNDRFDWFCAELTAGAVYRFASNVGSNTTVDLFGIDRETIIIASENLIGEDYFSVDFVPVESGTYYLRVKTTGVNFAVYTLTYSTTQVLPQTLPDQWDPRDNEFSGASNLTTPSLELLTHGPHTLTANDHGDWFRFTLAAGSSYEFAANGEAADTFGHLFDSDGATQLISDDDSGISLHFLIQFTAPADGVYFLLVRMADSGATGSYNLTHREIVLPNEDGDQWDPMDNALAGATELSPGAVGLTHGPHAIGGNDIADWFRFVLIKDWTYEFAGTGNADTIVELFSANGNTSILIDDDSGEGLNFKLQFTPTLTAEYTLRIMERLGRNGVYSLQYRGIAPAGVPTEPIPVQPDFVFRLENEIEFIHIPGGFGNAPAGSVTVTSIPADDNGLSDGLGVEITVRNGEVSLLQFPAITTGDQTVLIRVSVFTIGSAAAPALAAADGSFDGSLATNIPARSGIFTNGYKRMVLLYDPPSDGTVTPLFQAAGLDGVTTLFLDNVEIYLIPKNGSIQAQLLNGE